MRTTITIDDDLMSELKKRAYKKGIPIKDIINNVLRHGLKISGKNSKRQKYICPEYSLGNTSHYDIDHALKLAESLETEEIIRKIQLKK